MQLIAIQFIFALVNHKVFWNAPNDLIRMSLWVADRSKAARLTVDCDLDAVRVWRRHAVVGDAFKFLRLMPLDFCDFQKLAFAHETVCEDKRQEGDWIPAPWCTMSYVSVIGLVGVPKAAVLFHTVMLNKKKARGHSSRNYRNDSPYSSCSRHSLSEPTFGRCTTRDGPAGVTGCWMSCPGAQWWHGNSVIFNHYTTSSNTTKPFNHF